MHFPAGTSRSTHLIPSDLAPAVAASLRRALMPRYQCDSQIGGSDWPAGSAGLPGAAGCRWMQKHRRLQHLLRTPPADSGLLIEQGSVPLFPGVLPSRRLAGPESGPLLPGWRKQRSCSSHRPMEPAGNAFKNLARLHAVGATVGSPRDDRLKAFWEPAARTLPTSIQLLTAAAQGELADAVH